jgi:predicted amidohydrolase YtcJ
MTDIYCGGDILTLDPADAEPEAVAVRDGRVLATGDREQLLRAHPDAVEIDLGGRCLIPSFIDHHLHLTAIGLALLNRDDDERLFLDLAGATSPDAVIERVAERAAVVPAGEWILGMGWNQHDWGTPALPDHRELSRRVPHHPVFLVRIDAHSAWVNEAALAVGSFAAATPDPHGGRILRRTDGSPSGVLLERAVEPLLEHIPVAAGWEIREAFKRSARALAARGVTEVFDAGFMAPPAIVSMGVDFELMLELLLWADAEEPLAVDVNLMVPAPSLLADKLVADPDTYGELSERVRVTHIKLYADGAFGSRGAALTHAYVDDPGTSGFMRMSDDELEHQTRRALAAGFDISTHAIGDDAVHRVLHAYTRVADELGDIEPGRFRIEHFGYSSVEDQRLAAERGFLLVAQPNFIDPDDDGRTMEDWRLGAENGARVYPWRSLLDAGVPLAMSSDYYVAPGPALLDFHAVTTRSNRVGRPPGGWQPQERLSRQQALRLATTLHGAGGEVTEGIIRNGAAANLAVLSRNPLTCPADEILDITVRATVRRGVLTSGALPA